MFCLVWASGKGYVDDHGFAANETIGWRFTATAEELGVAGGAAGAPKLLSKLLDDGIAVPLKMTPPEHRHLCRREPS